jgi:hypothetical protein
MFSFNSPKPLITIFMDLWISILVMSNTWRRNLKDCKLMVKGVKAEIPKET